MHLLCDAFIRAGFIEGDCCIGCESDLFYWEETGDGWPMIEIEYPGTFRSEIGNGLVVDKRCFAWICCEHANAVKALSSGHWDQMIRRLEAGTQEE